MSKDAGRFIVALLEFVIDLKTNQILMMKAFASFPWEDERMRHDLRASLARQETTLEHAEKLLSDLKAFLERE